MADEYTNELAQAAQRLAEIIKPKPQAELTLKLISGRIVSVGVNHSTAIVDIGEAEIKVLNKSGDQLIPGESVWVAYLVSLADAIILFRTGLSTPGGGGGGGAVIGDGYMRANGFYRAEAAGYDGYGTVTVSVPNVTPNIGQIDYAVVVGTKMTHNAGLFDFEVV